MVDGARRSHRLHGKAERKLAAAVPWRVRPYLSSTMRRHLPLSRRTQILFGLVLVWCHRSPPLLLATFIGPACWSPVCMLLSRFISLPFAWKERVTLLSAKVLWTSCSKQATYIYPMIGATEQRSNCFFPYAFAYLRSS